MDEKLKAQIEALPGILVATAQDTGLIEFAAAMERAVTTDKQAAMAISLILGKASHPEFVYLRLMQV